MECLLTQGCIVHYYCFSLLIYFAMCVLCLVFCVFITNSSLNSYLLLCSCVSCNPSIACSPEHFWSFLSCPVCTRFSLCLVPLDGEPFTMLLSWSQYPGPHIFYPLCIFPGFYGAHTFVSSQKREHVWICLKSTLSFNWEFNKIFNFILEIWV